MPQPNATAKEIPAAACRFAATATITPASGDEPARVKILARSAKPIEHWYYGLVIHDMAGMFQPKPSIPLDYCHRDDEVLGHADTFNADPAAGLTVEGPIIPFTKDDRASEVLFRAAKGTPYEASINFAGDGVKLEILAEGQVATVNGGTIEGPATIVRQWPLRGVALCPYGADSNTSAQFADQGRTVPVTYLTQEAPTMPGTATAPEAPATETTPATTAEAPKTETPAETKPAPVAETTTTETPAETTPAATAETPAPAAANELSQAPGQKYLDAFGPAGAMYFAQGKTFEESQKLFAQQTADELKALKAENAQLRAQFSALRGESAPVSFQPEQTAEQRKAAELSAKTGNDNLAKLAASIKLPK